MDKQYCELHGVINAPHYPVCMVNQWDKLRSELTAANARITELEKELHDKDRVISWITDCASVLERENKELTYRLEGLEK